MKRIDMKKISSIICLSFLAPEKININGGFFHEVLPETEYSGFLTDMLSFKWYSSLFFFYDLK